jgi:hypothetical protein
MQYRIGASGGRGSKTSNLQGELHEKDPHRNCSGRSAYAFRIICPCKLCGPEKRKSARIIAADRPIEYQSGSDARSGQNAGELMVGTWHVAYTTEGSPSGDAFIQWHNDGTEWENISFPVLGGNICMGSWKTVDRWHVFRNHYGWLYNNGIVAGYFNETETDEVAVHGNSYTGLSETKFYDLTGKLTMELTGTATATRIAP